MPRSAEPRVPLSKERVLDAALAFADEHGIEALSMRRLAGELGVEAMSLYNHVANKEEILTGILELVAGQIEQPSGSRDWRAAMRRSAISARDLLLSHRWAARLWMSGQSSGPARLRHADWILRTLREAGFPSELIYHAFHLIQGYIFGYTFQQLSVPYEGEELASMAATFLEQFPVDQYPDLAEHIRAHMQPDHGDEGGFELGLDLILNGLERNRLTGTEHS
jgi:AcrR family transcriptional regulator